MRAEHSIPRRTARRPLAAGSRQRSTRPRSRRATIRAQHDSTFGARSVVHPAGDGWTGKGTNRSERTGLGFRWQARLRLGRLAWVDAEDRLDVEGGYGGARLLGVIPVGSARGPEVTRSQLVRNLAELAFAPLAASRARGLVWLADGEDAFTLAAPGIDADAIVRVTVDGAGDVRSARSPDRPRTRRIPP